MFARGPQSGYSSRAVALAMLPEGTCCKRLSAAGMTGYSICLPDGRQIAAAGSARQAWRDAAAWADRQQAGAARQQRVG
jgi:hypothetical protein